MKVARIVHGIMYLLLMKQCSANVAYWNDTAPTSSVFSVGNNNTNSGENI